MRRVPQAMFRFATGEKADQNGAVLEAFGVAGEHLGTTLGLDGGRERLRAVGWTADLEDEERPEVLKRLGVETPRRVCGWGGVRSAGEGGDGLGVDVGCGGQEAVALRGPGAALGVGDASAGFGDEERAGQ